MKILNKNIKLSSNNLGTHSGSIVNYLNSRQAYLMEALEIGGPATINMWSDRYGATVVEIIKKKNGRTFLAVQKDHAKMVGGNIMSEDQQYEYTRNLQGRVHYAEIIFVEDDEGTQGFVLEPRDFNRRTNRFNVATHGARISLGHRSEYRDPCF
tara:strand:- start:878 stop:1339 length:462 start_codon:yes stop_codon:yes gene_type:complete